MILIAAMTADHVIGDGDQMPWDLPEEYQHFLDLIEGQTVIMGRASYEIGKDTLTSAHNVVLSRSVDTIDGAVVCDNIEDAVALAKSYGRTVYSAGGGTIYAQTLPYAEALYLSYVKVEAEGDTYFPDFDPEEWSVAEREEHERYTFVLYRRRGTPPAPGEGK